MTYRSLLVFLDQDPLCVARTQVAFQLAKALDCHLVGVAPTGLVDLPAVAEAEPSLDEFAALQRATDADRSRLDAMSHWLERQGVTADLRVETTGIDIADAMLSHAADLNIDLIVMGAYGHARWIERLLGGATRGVLATMTLPVLMSH